MEDPPFTSTRFVETPESYDYSRDDLLTDSDSDSGSEEEDSVGPRRTPWGEISTYYRPKIVPSRTDDFLARTVKEDLSTYPTRTKRQDSLLSDAIESTDPDRHSRLVSIRPRLDKIKKLLHNETHVSSPPSSLVITGPVRQDPNRILVLPAGTTSSEMSSTADPAKEPSPSSQWTRLPPRRSTTTTFYAASIHGGTMAEKASVFASTKECKAGDISSTGRFPGKRACSLSLEPLPFDHNTPFHRVSPIF